MAGRDDKDHPDAAAAGPGGRGSQRSDGGAGRAGGQGATAPGPVAKPARFSGRSDRFGTVASQVKAHVSPHGQVTAVSMMKDEGPFVIEWIAHQIALGFTDIVVYTNDCSDGTDLMLMRLEELGLAHHRPNVIPPGLRPQPSAIAHAQEEPVVQASDWVMVFDADEFLSIRYGDGTLDALLSAVAGRGANGIVVTWRIFGSGGVTDWSRAPVTEQYLRAAPMQWNKGWGVKTLFRFHPDQWRLGIHRPKIRNRWIDTGFPDEIVWLNGSGRVMEDYFKFRGWRSISRTVGYDWVQLNHYAVKSVDSYALRKLRGNVNFKKDKYNSDYWALQDRNEEADDMQLRYSGRRGAIIEGLLRDPVLRKLHDAAVGEAEARLAELRRTEAYDRLKADLALASARPIGEVDAKPPQPRDPAKIAARMTEVERRRTSADKERRAAEVALAVVVPEAAYLDPVTSRSDPAGVGWFGNRGVDLPADPAIFTPFALRAIMAGKFDRGLARRLPAVVPHGARVLEVGAGCGFLSVQLLKTRDDLVLAVQEQVPPLGQIMAEVIARNGLAGSARLRVLGPVLPGVGAGALADELRALVAAETPDVLILSDPRVGPDDAGQIPGGAAGRPAIVLVSGRALLSCRDDPAVFDGPMQRQGYAPADLFEPRLARAYARLP